MTKKLDKLIQESKSVGEVGKIITEAQEKLRERFPKNYLLNLVNVDTMGIHWTSKFGKMYQGMSLSKGLKKYVNDLKKEDLKYKN